MIKRLALQYGKIIVPIAILIVIIIQGRKELAGISVQDVLDTIRAIPHGGFYWAVLVGLLAIMTMFFYDYLLLYSLQVKVSLGKIFRVSWIANTFNGVLGFGGLAGASLRALMYKPYVKETGTLIKALAWLAPSLGSGLSILAFLAIINVFPVRPVLEEMKILWLALFGVFAVLPAYIFFSKWKGKEMATAKLTMSYTVISFVEWASAGVTAYFILMIMGLPISFTEALGAYVIAAVAGTISMVPGGVGSFDLVFLIALQSYGIEKSVILSALILFRLVYYFIPFGLGLVIAAFEMPSVVAGYKEEPRNMRRFKGWMEFLGSIPRKMVIGLGDWSLAALTFLTSMILIVSMLIPVYVVDFEFIRGYIPYWMMVLFAGLTLGFGLIILALTPGIYHRTKRSYKLAVTAICCGAVTSLLHGMYWKVSVFMLAAAVLLWLLRRQFIHSRLEMTTAGSIVFSVSSFLIVLFYYSTSLSYGQKEINTNHISEDLVFLPFAGVNAVSIIAILFVPLYLGLGKWLYGRMRR